MKNAFCGNHKRTQSIKNQLFLSLMIFLLLIDERWLSKCALNMSFFISKSIISFLPMKRGIICTVLHFNKVFGSSQLAFADLERSSSFIRKNFSVQIL